MVVKERQSKSQPLTMEQLQEKKLRERLVTYRDLVKRAAAGERLPDDDMATAADILDALRLPPYSWARDVQAQRDDDAAAERESQLRAAGPEREARERDLTERVTTMERELNRLRLELRSVATGEPMRLVTVMQRRNELRVNHPHLLGDIEQAVVFRLQATRKAAKPAVSAGDADGWSVS